MPTAAPVVRRLPRRREFGLGMLLGDTLGIWFTRLPSLLLITVLVYAPLFAYQWWFIQDLRTNHAEITSTGLHLRAAASELLTSVAASVTAGAFSYGVFRTLQRQKVGILACVGQGLSRLPSILGVAVVVGVLVGLIGLPARLFAEGEPIVQFLLLIPQIWLQVTLSTAVPAAVIERLGVGAALARSFRLTQGYRLSIFLAWLLFILVLMFVMIPIMTSMLRPGLHMLQDPEALEARVDLLLWSILGISTVVASMLAVGQCVAYSGLRLSKEGVTADELVKAFE